MAARNAVPIDQPQAAEIWADMREAEIREYFAAARTDAPVS